MIIKVYNDSLLRLIDWFAHFRENCPTGVIPEWMQKVTQHEGIILYQSQSKDQTSPFLHTNSGTWSVAWPCPPPPCPQSTPCSPPPIHRKCEYFPADRPLHSPEYTSANADSTPPDRPSPRWTRPSPHLLPVVFQSTFRVSFKDVMEASVRRPPPVVATFWLKRCDLKPAFSL